MQRCSGGACRPRSKRLQPTRLPLQQLLTNDCDPNLASMWCATMFEEKNSLPGSELHFPIDDRDGFAWSRQNHANVRRHGIASFRAGGGVIGLFRHNSVGEILQVPSARSIGIFPGG